MSFYHFHKSGCIISLSLGNKCKKITFAQLFFLKRIFFDRKETSSYCIFKFVLISVSLVITLEYLYIYFGSYEEVSVYFNE